MKRITKRMQQLGQRAEQLREVVNQMPGRAERVRQSMISATEKLQQVRADLTFSAEALRGKANSNSAELLSEIGDVGKLLQRSGFSLQGVDWDISSTRRLQVHIERVEPTTAGALRILLAKHDDKPAARTILTALIQAQEAAEEVEVGQLVWTDVVIDIGPVTTVRIGWRELEDVDDDTDGNQGSESAAATSSLPWSGAPGTSTPTFTSGSFLRPKTPEVPLPMITDPVEPATTTRPQGRPSIPVAAQPSPTRTPTWGRDRTDSMSLDRFKKMPDVGRRGHGSR